MQAFSKITSKGQTTIPKAVRDSLDLKAGDTISYVTMDRGVMIVPRNRPIQSIFGALEDYAIPETTLEDYDNAIREGVAIKTSRNNINKLADDAA